MPRKKSTPVAPAPASVESTIQEPTVQDPPVQDPPSAPKTPDPIGEPTQNPTPAPIQDPIGDETDGEARTSTDPEIAAEIDSDPEAQVETAESGESEADLEEIAAAEDDEVDDQGRPDEAEPDFVPKLRPPVKLERLQKILAQAGIASRRKAEELIEQGRVQVNGTIVTALGTKADAGRDHIRVDGKLLHGAERLRYFVLNKPRGFVTTVKDPEGRPTVMQFFEKMHERLYPVGRLDYMSEGLLLVTNDGELANKLTKASSGVEKTYLVKVAGQPTEDELDILRGGVSIERGKPGEGRVRTSPARIRQVRQGDNPWYEVVLIEGRNRELRKMFEEIGHFVEKIRRVGYGPLILDQEPGNLRELDENELDLIRKAADGKLRTPKAKEVRRRNIADSLPPEKPAFKPRPGKSFEGKKDYQPKKSFGARKPFAADKPFRGSARSANFGSQPPAEAGPRFDPTRTNWRREERPTRPPSRFAAGPPRSGSGTGESRPPAGRTYADRPARNFGGKPAVGRNFGPRPSTGRPFTPPGRPSEERAEGRSFPSRPPSRPFAGKPSAGRDFPSKPAFKKPEGGDWKGGKRPFTPRSESTRPPAPQSFDDLGPTKRTRALLQASDGALYGSTSVWGPYYTNGAYGTLFKLASSQPIPVRFDSISLGPDNQIQLQASGPAGHYALEATTNLSDWAELTNFSTTETIFLLLDSATHAKNRVYRLHLLP